MKKPPQTPQKLPPIPLREWSAILRWTFLALTAIALIWVARLRLDCNVGATLGSSHPVREASDEMAPRIPNGRDGTDGWLVALPPEQVEGFLDTLDLTLQSQCLLALDAPEHNAAARFGYCFGKYVPRPPLRLLFGFDPPPEKLHGYADWLDTLAECAAPVPRVRLRGIERFAHDWLRRLEAADSVVKPLPYPALFAPATWRESGDTLIFRLINTAGDTADAEFKPAVGKVVSPRAEASQLRSRLLWWLPLMAVAVVIALLRERRRDPPGFRNALSGALGMGVWTIAAWQWLLNPLDSLLWLMLPLPFWAGIRIARWTRMLGSAPNPDATIRKWWLRFRNPLITLALLLFGGGIVINGVPGRLLLAAFGALVGVAMTTAWCIAEEKQASSRHAATSAPNYRWFVIAFAAPVLFLLFIQHNGSLDALFTRWGVAETNRAEHLPYWLGPLDASTAPRALDALAMQRDIEWYHPARWQPRQLVGKENDWLRAAPTNLRSMAILQRKPSTAETEMHRDALLSAWLNIVDRMDNFVQCAAVRDSGIVKLWRNANAPIGALARVTDRLSGIAGEWFERQYEALEQAGNQLRHTALQSYQRNPKLLGGEWFDAFHRGGGETVAIFYLPNADASILPALRMQLPASVRIAGPAAVHTAECSSIWWGVPVLITAGIALGLFGRNNRRRLFVTVAALFGGAGIAAAIGFPGLGIALAAGLTLIAATLLVDDIALAAAGLLAIATMMMLTGIIGGLMIIVAIARRLSESQAVKTVA